MSEMGYPLIGENSLWNLHYSEWRILAEGQRVQRLRQDHEMEKAESGRDRPKGKPSKSTKQTASKYAEELRAAKQGKHPDQLQGSA